MSQRDNGLGENRVPAQEQVPAELVAELRQITGLPVLVCRDALASIPDNERDAAIREIEKRGISIGRPSDSQQESVEDTNLGSP
jgi:hypothetical protein